MRIQYIAFLISIIFLLLRLTTPVFAMESKGIETKIAAGLGIEYLDYEEQLPESSLKSDVNVSNIVFRVEGVKRWEKIFIGIDGVIPVANYDRQEEWSVDGKRDQTNSLRYEITQLAIFAGSPIVPLFNPYLGLRSTWSKQKRSDFKDHGGSLLSSARITEKVTAHFVSIGFRGDVLISKKWEVTYGAEYNSPFYTKVTNDELPGWKEKNINGYSWRAYSELLYVIKEKFSFSLLICAGHQHWDGSGWETYKKRRIKWPENDTYFINSFLNLIWSF
jgi:hypothetical protein